MFSNNNNSSSLMSQKMDISLIPLNHLDLVWGQVVDHLIRPIEYSFGRYQIMDIYDEVANGNQTLWVVYDNEDIVAAMTTRVLDYPGKRVLACMFCGGDRMDEWAGDVDRVFSEYAKELGCASIELCGRLGWKKVLTQLNWQHRFVAFEKELIGDDNE